MQHTERLRDLFGFKPYAYQERVATSLLAGRNVILRSPTGSGKTEAALGPYLIARSTCDATFPLKAMIASPMKTLAKSIYARAQKLSASLGLDVRLHTGEDQGAPLLEGDIVVTTIDQLMSNYAHIPLSMSNGRANIGAGAVISSYIVFDEFHLHDPKRAFCTALAMIDELRGIAPFLLMTATLSGQMVERLAKLCDADVIEPDAQELEAMPSQQKIRNFRREAGMLTAEAVACAHERRSLAILNTVARAQDLAANLEQRREQLGLSQNTRIELIHSQFLPSDRASKEAKLEAWMGKSSTENIILVATQAVEVGINISSEHLHTELCPANSLLQRAGRCARFEGEIGTVHVYDLAVDERGNKRTRPYHELKAELEATWESLAALENPVGVKEEAALIDAVHSARDLEYLRDALAGRELHLGKLREARRGDRGQASALIREILNQSVILHPEPHTLTTWREVSRCEMIGLSPGKLTPVLAAQTDLWGETDGWAVMIPTETQTDAGTRLTWNPCNDPRQLSLAPIVALNPDRANYTAEYGLRLDILEPSVGTFPRHKDRPSDAGERQDWWYTFETYRQHIENVARALEKHAPEVLRACPKVDARFGLPAGTLEHAIRVAIAAHDIGKLSAGWQDWSRAWQRQQLMRYPDLLWDGIHGSYRVTPQPAGLFSAHTDYHPMSKDHPEIDDAAREKAFKLKRPGHAGESSTVLEKTYYDRFLERIGNEDLGAQVFCGVYGAIARHHGARSEGKADAWKLDPNSSLELQAVFRDLSHDDLDADALAGLERRGVPAAEPSELMPNPNEPLAWMTYTLVSRALRLADNNSFERYSNASQGASQ